MELNHLTIEELVELKNQIDNYLYSYEDGYFYICKVRSYGRNWDEHISNYHSLQQLCYEYNGDDGIVDVYSNNPDLSELHNYGDTKFIPSKEDYRKWREYEYLKRIIPEIEKELEEWDNRDNLPFNKRPNFKPIYTQENLEEYKKELAEYDMSFVKPKSYTSED